MRRTVLLTCATLASAGTHERGRYFLVENEEKEGVITLDSGLQYKVLKDGDGKYHPLKDTKCEMKYEGRTFDNWPNGPAFDGNMAKSHGTRFAPSGVITGWTEAMQLMVEGDR